MFFLGDESSLKIMGLRDEAEEKDWGEKGREKETEWKPDFPRGTLVLYSRVDDPCHFVSYGIVGIPTDYTWILNSFLERWTERRDWSDW